MDEATRELVDGCRALLLLLTIVLAMIAVLSSRYELSTGSLVVALFCTYKNRVFE